MQNMKLAGSDIICLLMGVAMVSGASLKADEGSPLKDGSSPEEVCPCTQGDSCKDDDDRHVFGSDQLDITKFGLISPCQEEDYYPCCPVDPPPAKNYNLTAADLKGLSKAELIELGILNDKGIIGASSIPLAEQEKFKLLSEAHKNLANSIPSVSPTLNQLSSRPAYPATINREQLFQQSFVYNHQLYRPLGYDSRVLLLSRY